MNTKILQGICRVAIPRERLRSAREDMKWSVLLVGREEGNIGAGTVQGIENVDRWPWRRDAVMNKAPATGIWIVYKYRNRERVQ
jgi:hypothetical protein